MTVRLERWKSKPRFPTFPPPLEISQNTARFPHFRPFNCWFFLKKPITWNRTKSVNLVPGLKCQLSPRPYLTTNMSAVGAAPSPVLNTSIAMAGRKHRAQPNHRFRSSIYLAQHNLGCEPRDTQ